MHRRNIFFSACDVPLPAYNTFTAWSSSAAVDASIVRPSLKLDIASEPERVSPVRFIDGSALIADAEPISTALLGFTCPSQFCSCPRALQCFHQRGPTCRFAYPASTVFVEESTAQPSHPPSKAADHGGSPRLLGRTREQSVPVDRVNFRQADAAMGFASCRFSGTLLAQHDFDPLIRLPNRIQRDVSRNLFCDPTDDRRSCHQPPEAASGSNPLMGLQRCLK